MSNSKKKKTIFLVPHSHYDVVWAMNKQDYLNIHKKLLRQALNMIEQDNFKFLIEQTYMLEQIESQDPQLFSDLKKAIEAGDIEIADGEYLMPDPMIPAEEVLVRTILYGKLYAKKKFGVDVPVAWMSDGFGLNAQLPQIYKKSGYKWLAFRRGLPKSIGHRLSEFMWEGLDRSRILAHWMPLGYRAGLYLDTWEKNYKKLAQLATTSNVLMPCGSGGMVVQEEIPAHVRQWNENHRGIEMKIATPSAFFLALEKNTLPATIFKGELYSADLEDIFPDVVSSRMRLKLAIRECEDLILSTEKAVALAYLHGARYPKEMMTSIWKKMMFLAFHDVVPSCGIDEIYDEAWQYIDDIKKNLPEYLLTSVHSLLPEPQHGTGIIVFNPHSWEIHDWIEVELHLGTGWSKEPGIYFKDREIVSEVRNIERWDDDSIQRAKIGFTATVPPFGYRIYEVKPKSKKFRSRKIKIKENEVSTKFFNLGINPETGILDVHDKAGQHLLRGNEVVIDSEVGDLYLHRSNLDQPIGSESGQGIRFGSFKPEGLTIEKGPVRTLLTFKNSFYCLRWPYYLTHKYKPVLYRQKTMDIEKTVIVYENIPRIDFFTKLDLKQPHVRVRLRFDTCMATPRYTRETQFGAVNLPHVRTLEEGVKMPSLTWLSCFEQDRGLAMFTKGVPINEVKGGEIFLTLLRSVSVLSADGVSGPLIPTPGAMELGEHTYVYSIYPHEGNWQSANIPREAYRFSEGLFPFQVDTLPSLQEYESIRIEPENLIITSLKKAEEDEALILRFFEAYGRTCTAELRLMPQVHTVKVVNLLEHEEDPRETKRISFRNEQLTMEVKPFEIVTLKLFFEHNRQLP